MLKSFPSTVLLQSVASLGLVAGLAACSSTPTLKKVVLDESPSRPSWVNDAKTSWEDSGKIEIKATQEIRGNERLAACYDLARLNAKSALIAEVQEEIKGVFDTHEATLSENAEVVLSKSRSAEFGGKVSGIRFTEDYFSRFRIGEDERIDCFVLGELSKEDYSRLKRAILFKVEEADPKIKEQIKEKHIQFFEKSGSESKS